MRKFIPLSTVILLCSAFFFAVNSPSNWLNETEEFYSGFLFQTTQSELSKTNPIAIEPIHLSQPLEGISSVQAVCIDTAGSVSRTLNGNPAALNDIMCFGDSYSITHNGDAIFTGDGDPTSQAGLDLMIFTAPPTISGPLMSDIESNSGYVLPSGSLVGTDAAGNVTFSNMGTYQTLFNSGNPTILWFAPVTIDDVTSTPKTISEDVGGVNECVNVSVGEAFSIVFLNEIDTANFITPAGGNLCQGAINVRGGLPQWNGSNYAMSLTLSTNASVTGNISTANATHNSLVVFTVPQPGIYDFVVSDNQGCSRTFQLNMNTCVACTDDAGTQVVSLYPSASSIAVTALCSGDTLNVSHNGDQDLGGDPNGATPSGIQYAIYTCQPTATGQTLGDITGDPCIVLDGSGTVPQLVSNTDINGNTFISNSTGLYQGYLTNAGLSPTDTLWFAPITVDAFPPATWEGVNGPNECTNVNTSAAFPVVFLNNISAGNITNNFGGNGCQGTIDASGGLPEVDGSNYLVTVELLSNPSITGTLVTPATHNGTMVFEVPQPGNYQITVTDANGCSSATGFIGMTGCTLPCSNFSFTGGITSNYNGANISCSGANDGAITIQPTGGNYPYTYTWQHDPALSDSIATNLANGTYNLTITDNDGCTLDTSITLTSPSPLFVGVTGSNPLCSGDNTGQVYVSNIGGGTMPYTFTWSNGVSSSIADTISNLTAGNYSLTVTDINGCTAQASTTLGDPPPLNGNFTAVTDATCTDVADGSATITPTGGTSPYSYNWQHDPALTDSTATNLAVGRYYVDIIDNNGCISSDSVDIDPTITVTATLDSVDVSCFGGNDGAVTVTPMTSGGAPNLPYSYTWSPNTSNTNNIATGLSANTYSVTVSDAIGCLFVDSTIVNQPDSITIVLVNSSNVLCNGETSGQLTVAASGGISPYTYDWGNGNTGATLSNVGAGTYTVTVTDANNCSNTLTTTISQPPAIILSNVNTVPVSCNGFSDGGFSVTVTGGSGSFAYAWSTNPSVDTFPSISNLTAGTYFLTTTDATNCSRIDTFVLSEPAALVATTGGTNQSCFNIFDGSVFVIPSGGTAPYTFLWNDANASTTDTVTGLGAATYTVTVTDANGCTTVSSITITAPPAITSTISTTPVSCTGGTDGTATVTASGGSGGFSYLWSNNQTGQMATQLGAGIYFVTITDAAGCSLIDTTTVNELPQLSPAGGIFASPVTCFGGNDGYIDVLGMSGGTAPYTYSWNTTPPQDSSTAINLTAGTYSLVVNDANGCTFGPVNITVNEPSAAVTATTSVFDPTCNSVENGSITVIPSGGTPSYTYQWDDPNNQTTQTATNLGIGTYNVTVTDANGCSTTASGTLTQPDQVTALISTQSTTCNGGKDGRILLDTVFGGTPPYSYSIDGVNFQPTNILFFGLLAGNYDVIVRDANGCRYEETVLVDEPPLIVVDLGPDIEVELGDSVELEAIINVFDDLSYTWTSSPNDSLMSCLDCFNPMVAPVRTTTYTVIVEDTSGCTATDAIIVRVDKNRNVFIPNGFTPNSDGRNDVFTIFGGTGVVQVRTFIVFDRWGEVMHQATNFQPNDPQFGWDGSFRGKRVQPGVYVYYAEIEFADGLIFPYKGDVTLVR